MNLRKLSSEIAKREGKKSQVSIGDVREILSHLSDLLIEHPEIVASLWSNGVRRKKKKR